MKWSNSVKKFTLQLRYNKLFSFSMLKISSNNSLPSGSLNSVVAVFSGGVVIVLNFCNLEF